MRLSQCPRLRPRLGAREVRGDVRRTGNERRRAYGWMRDDACESMINREERRM